MITTCQECGKEFDVLYPELWRYKINKNYTCSWTCFRLMESRKKEEKMNKPKTRPRMTADQMATAMRIWREGGDIDTYLKEHGIGNIQKWKENAKKRKPEETPRQKAAEKAVVPTVKLDGPIRIETPEQNKVKIIETPEKKIGGLCPPPDEIETSCRVTAIDTPIGEFHYDKRHGYLDWDWDNSTMSLNLEEWKEFRKWFPIALRQLGVKL